MYECRVLPSLREATVIEEYITMLEFAQDPLLLVLLDRVTGFACGDFELFSELSSRMTMMMRFVNRFKSIFILAENCKSDEY
jgi:hypothetical protein